MRGQAACRYWGGGATPSENIPAGLAHLMALLKQLMEKAIVPGTESLAQGMGWGQPEPGFLCGLALLCALVWPGLAWERGENG